MPAPDNLQISLAEADLKKINDALDALEAALAPVLITLTGKEVQRLPKASDASLPFMQQALDLAEQQPRLAPGYVDIAGLRQDLVAWEQLQRIGRRLQPLASNLASTQHQAKQRGLCNGAGLLQLGTAGRPPGHLGGRGCPRRAQNPLRAKHGPQSRQA